MPFRDDALRLAQMLEQAREAAQLAENRTAVDLTGDRLLGLALLQLLLMLSQTAGRISPACQADHPDIPWTQLASLHDRLIQGYDTIDFEILWKILTADLPPLIAILQHAVGPTDK